MEGLRFCKKCDYDLRMTRDALKYIENYVEKIPEDMRKKEDEYQHCLEICSGCDMLLEGTCKVCGCYVAIRAAVAGRHCPSEKW